MKVRLLLSAALLFCIVNNSFSQVFRGQEAREIIQNSDLIRFKECTKVPNYLRFTEGCTEQDALTVVKSFIKNSNADLQLKLIQNQGDGSQTHRYFQTVSGYPIEFTVLNLQVKNGLVTELNGEILDQPDIVPNFIISEATALQTALQCVNAEQYMWEVNSEFLPQGEKVIVPDKINLETSTLKSAYKFDIYALKPHSRLMIYVDAETGEIIVDYPLIHEAVIPGTAITGYYGERPISIAQSGAQYILYDNSRGNGIHTYDSQNRAWYLPQATDYFNSTTHWENTPGAPLHIILPYKCMIICFKDTILTVSIMPVLP